MGNHATHFRVFSLTKSVAFNQTFRPFSPSTIPVYAVFPEFRFSGNLTGKFEHFEHDETACRTTKGRGRTLADWFRHYAESQRFEFGAANNFKFLNSKFLKRRCFSRAFAKQTRPGKVVLRVQRQLRRKLQNRLYRERDCRLSPCGSQSVAN